VIDGRVVDRGELDQVEAVAPTQTLGGLEGVGEVEAGVEEHDLDAGLDPDGEIDHHGVLHGAGHGDVGEELPDGPGEDLLGRPGIEVGQPGGGQLAPGLHHPLREHALASPVGVGWS